MNNTTYSDISYKLTKNITKKEKKENGIFFTNPSTIIKNLDILKPYIKNIKNVLEPSCGSCEFINILNKYNNKLKITELSLTKLFLIQSKYFKMIILIFK